MLSVDHARWGQTPEDLRRLAMGAPHRRTRERFLALHEIVRGGCATRVAVRAGRHPRTVTGWLHAYDARECTFLAVPGSGGLSAAPSEIEGGHGWSWARTIWADMLG